MDLPDGGLAWNRTLSLVAADGVRLRGALWLGGDGGGSRGLVLLLQGRTEFLEKHTPTAAQLVRRGFAVASLDWRGQGLSQRLVKPDLKGHVAQFTDFHSDLAALLTHPEVAAVAGPRVMVANSMGAAIGLGVLYRGADPVHERVQAAIFLAPMFGIVMSPSMRFLRRVLLPMAKLAGRLERWPPLPGVALPYAFSGFEDNVLTGDQALFDWLAAAIGRHPQLQLAMPTLGWLRAAMTEMAWLARQGPLGCPALCLLGARETVVDSVAVRAGAARIGARLEVIEDARHDLLMETEPVRLLVWEVIDRFLERAGI